MEREPTSGRDNSIIGGSYGGTTPRAEQARQRSVLAGEQEQMRGSTPNGDGGGMYEGDNGEHKSVHDRAEEGKEKAAARLDRASEQIRHQATGPVKPVGEKVAGTLDKTADYLHEHETDEIMDDVRAYVRRHPMQAVAGAAVGGFFFARLLP